MSNTQSPLGGLSKKYDSSGRLVGITGQDGRPSGLVAFNPNTGELEDTTARTALARSVTSIRESSRTKILLLGDTIAQNGSVLNFASAANPAQYSGGTTDAEVYSTAAGYLSILGGAQPNNKGLYIAPGAAPWDLAAGQSLLIQVKMKVASLPAGAAHYFGNSNNAINKGVLMAMTPGGALQPYVKCGAAAAQNLGSSGTLVTANTDFTFSMLIDGTTKLMNGLVNGILQGAYSNKAVTPDSAGSYSTLETNIPFAFGSSSHPSQPPLRDMNAFSLKAFRLAIIEPGKTLNNFALLDWAFRQNPNVIFADGDYEVV